MTKLKFRKRNKLDIILTDSRPVELPKNFSLVYFYNYLNKSKKIASMFETVKKELRASEDEGKGLLWGPNWHAAPLKYHIYKNRFEMREMSLISPVSMIELPLFIEAYEKQLLLLSSEEGFSVRKHEANEGLKYIEINSDKGVIYSAEKSIESSGSFYTIYPYKYISEFQNSSYWYQLNREYRYFGKIDYSKCFDSIYSHTYTWLITKNSVDGKDYGRSQYFLNMCDRLMQNFNGSVTNGIVVGPEFSRIMMEIIAQNIDKRVKTKLFNEGLNDVRDYSVCRYVDDIFIFADEEKIVETIIELYRDEAERFHFRLNDQKRLVGKLPYAWFGWKQNIHSVNEYICKTLFNDAKTDRYIIKYNPKMLPNMKMMYQNIVAEYPEYQAKVTAYVLTTLYKKTMQTDKPLFSDEKLVEKLLYFLDAIFYFYSFSLSYNNTEKVISILDVLGSQVPDDIFRDCLHRVLSAYSLSLAKANTEDVVNLFLLSSMYTIELPDIIEESQVEKIEKTGNPLMYAIFLLYFSYNKTKEDEFRKVVENKISHAISDIYKPKDFFMYTESWWLYIFANCPLISQLSRDEIINKLKEQRDYLKKASSKHLAKDAKLIVIEYLLDDTEKYKFMNWDMERKELFSYTVFTTYERTLFNGYNTRESVYEDLSY